MRIDVVTLFPDMVQQAAGVGVTGRARERGLWRLATWNPREFATDAHRTVDDRPYGGGPGMVMLPGPLGKAVAAAKAAQVQEGVGRPHVIHMTPAGKPLRHARVAELAAAPGAGYVVLAGRYEGIDERLIARRVDEEVSIGDFVLSGGEPAALCIVDAVARLLPEVVGRFDSVESDSFHSGILDTAYYTRPAEYRGWTVPEVLLSGNHAAIARHRREDALRRTFERRPELLEGVALDANDRRFLRRLEAEAKAGGGAPEGGN